MQSLELLMQYQSIESQIAEIEKELRNSEIRKKLLHARNYLTAAQENLQKMETEAAALSKTYEKTKQHYDETLAELEKMSIHFEAADEESELDDVEDMQRQAASISTRLSQQEKELRNILKRLGTIDQEIRKMAANIPKARKDYSELKVVYDEQLSEINKRTAPLREQLSEVEAQLSEDLVRRYKRARAVGPNPIVALVGNRCTGCNMEMPAAVAKKIRDENRLAECENCGRILYIQ